MLVSSDPEGNGILITGSSSLSKVLESRQFYCKVDIEEADVIISFFTFNSWPTRTDYEQFWNLNSVFLEDIEDNSMVLDMFFISLENDDEQIQNIDQPIELKVQLFPYQIKAVSWMLSRETTKSEITLPYIQMTENLYVDPFSMSKSDSVVVDRVDIFGGVLADEMGLGKSLETLGLIAAHPVDDDQFCRATLIVCPSVLISQWVDEIKFKTKLSAKVYPCQRFDCDLVLVSYDTIKSEKHRALLVKHNERQLRNAKKVKYEPSRLVTTKWWRVVLDEAQMVGSVKSVISEVGLLFQCKNRWIVSGTPISNSLNDLESSCAFLGLCIQWKVIKKALNNGNMACLQSFLDLFNQLGHRQKQERVNIQLPPQDNETIKLEFTKAERYFYQYLIEQCLKELENDYSDRTLLTWIDSLRQSCCHPILSNHHKEVTGEISTNSLGDVLDGMIKKTNLDVRTLYQRFISLSLKRAMLWESKKEYSNAIEDYLSIETEIRKTIKETEDETDKRQLGEKLHQCLFSHAYVLLEQEEKEASDAMFSKAEEVRNSLLSESEAKIRIATEKLKLEVGKPLYQIPDPLFNGGIISGNVLGELKKFTLTVNHGLERLMWLKDKILEIIFKETLLENYDEDAKEQEHGHGLQRRFNELLSAIFSLVNMEQEVRYVDEEENQFSISSLSLPLIAQQIKRLISHGKDGVVMKQEHNLLTKELNHIHDWNANLKKYVEYLQKLSNLMRSVWNRRIVYYKQLQVLSDKLVLPDQDFDQDELFSQIETTTTELSQMISRMNYLNNIDKKDDVCPICKNEFSKGLMTECGHVGCFSCMNTWFRKRQRCPICVKTLKYSDLKRIVIGESCNTQIKVPAEFSNLVTKKNFGTKINAITSYLVHLSNFEPEAKSVIFTQWPSALALVEQALKECNVNFVTLNKKIQDSLHKFNHDSNVKVMLLYGLSQSAGLTLTRATHLFFLEPCINKAIEKQVAARIHRIGQTRPTFVHRLVMAQSIEERIADDSEENGGSGWQNLWRPRDMVELGEAGMDRLVFGD